MNNLTALSISISLLADRFTASLMLSAASVGPAVLLKVPENERPIGVRAAEIITTLWDLLIPHTLFFN